MSCGNPHDVRWSEVLERVYSYLGGELDETGHEKIRPPGNDANFKQPVQRLRFSAARAWRRAGTPASPRTAAITAVFVCQIERIRTSCWTGTRRYWTRPTAGRPGGSTRTRR